MRGGLIVSAVGGRPISAMVCEPCKRRKKACDKGLPGCGRCSRLLVKCSYTPDLVSHGAASTGNRLGGGCDNSPPLINTVPDLVAPGQHLYQHLTPPQSEFGSISPSQPASQVSVQIQRLLDAISRKAGQAGVQASCEFFLRGFNNSLPIVEREDFWTRFEGAHGSEEIDEAPPKEDPEFAAIIVAVFLVSFLFPQEGGDLSTHEVYTTLKCIFGSLQNSANVNIETLQVGLLIASWEWCQDLQQDAWLTIGGCVRMAQVLGLHHLVREELPQDANERAGIEKKRKLWWCCVVLERIVQAEPKNRGLPCASAPPSVDDFLPEPHPVRVGHGILLPKNVDLASPPQTRGFTSFGTFSTTIQTTFLSDLVMQHVMCRNRRKEEREEDEKRLELTLQYFTGALIPGPGQSSGGYCGAFGLLANAQFVLHQDTLLHATDHNTVIRAKSPIQSLARVIIHTTKYSTTGVPMDCSSLAFWSHKSLYTSALMHIDFGDRNEDWQSDLNILKKYFEQFEGRFGIYKNYLKEIVTAEHAAL